MYHGQPNSLREQCFNLQKILFDNKECQDHLIIEHKKTYTTWTNLTIKAKTNKGDPRSCPRGKPAHVYVATPCQCLQSLRVRGQINYLISQKLNIAKH